MRKTKIVCTIGPASEQPEVLRELMLAGMNVARLNFSHGTHEDHAMRIDRIREVAKELNHNIAIMLDTQGPEIRIGVFEDDQIVLNDGDIFTLTPEKIEGTQEKVSVSYQNIANDVHVGSTVLIDDGHVELVVEEIKGNDIVCRVVDGGVVKNRKGVNLPGVKVNLPSITAKDVEDIAFGVSKGVDIIAASFVQKAADVFEMRQLLQEHGGNHISIMAKIENEEGVRNTDEILAAVDSVMVARGDLGVEIPAEDVPLIQKKLIEACNRVGKPVVTATHMLDSMEKNPRPTRAEATDVANAIFDGTDAIMLSGESAAGKYPVESVKTMDRIARSVENSPLYQERARDWQGDKMTITDVMGQAVYSAASSLHAAAILTPTESGYTANTVSRLRPSCPIVAVTPHKHVVNQLLLNWGVYPILFDSADNTDEMMEKAIQAAVGEKIIKHGDLIVISAGVPVREPGNTNMLKVHVVGKVVARGRGFGDTSVTGKVVIMGEPGWQDLVDETTVLVAKSTDKGVISFIEKAAALVTEEGGLTSHAAIVGLNLDKPVIIGAESVTTLLKQGDEVTVDPHQGHIYHGFSSVL
ncbi:pyruvate kinase [Ammoniphilus oxalaticus]|uniref:Pyruvate kinase n=1 Tax=Ammoniphilus oxalaticus TaxID=66863 RepID=A0A419SFQ1_9BACL|nr:pyruvate kinase [Ammoniphilus oxalaticus]RKD22610.1 pyruvate kinase [Ammoniphilus oxalaticus]